MTSTARGPEAVKQEKQHVSITLFAGHSHNMGMVTAQAVAAPEAEQVEQAISSDIHGFELQRQQWVAEYNSTVLLYKHKKTGLQILILLPHTLVSVYSANLL